MWWLGDEGVVSVATLVDLQMVLAISTALGMSHPLVGSRGRVPHHPLGGRSSSLSGVTVTVGVPILLQTATGCSVPS